MRVLHAGGGPERPLDRGAGLAQLGEARAVEDLLEAHVGGARVPQARRAEQFVVPAGSLEPLVHLGVDAGDEEARH